MKKLLFILLVCVAGTSCTHKVYYSVLTTATLTDKGYVFKEIGKPELYAPKTQIDTIYKMKSVTVWGKFKIYVNN